MGAWLTLAGPGTEPPRCQPRRGKPPRETAATVSNSRGWGSWEFCARFSPTVGAECQSELLRAVRALQPPSRGAFPHPLCRQNHSRPSHGTVETWSGSPTPPCAPNHKLMAAEQGKNFLPGESRGPGWGHWRGGVPMGPGPPAGTRNGGLEASPLSGGGGLRPGPVPVSITVPLSQAPRTPRRTAWMLRSAGWRGLLDGWRTRWARRAPTSIPPSPLHPPSPSG